MDSNEIANYRVEERLRDGRTVTIRAIRPDDKGRVIDTLRAVSPESFYRRAFSPKRSLSDEELKRLTEVDFKNVVALVATMREEEEDRIVGGGRFVRTKASAAKPAAEVAFLMDDSHQGCGIGTLIFRHLAALGRASGIEQFEAEVLPSNNGMLTLFMRSGLRMTTDRSRDSVSVILDLSGGPDARKGTP